MYLLPMHVCVVSDFVSVVIEWSQLRASFVVPVSGAINRSLGNRVWVAIPYSLSSEYRTGIKKSRSCFATRSLNTP